MNILSESEVHATVEDPANSLQPSRHLSDYTIPLDDTARAAIGIQSASRPASPASTPNQETLVAGVAAYNEDDGHADPVLDDLV